MNARSLITTTDLSSEEIALLVADAAALRVARGALNRGEQRTTLLAGRTVALLFENITADTARNRSLKARADLLAAALATLDGAVAVFAASALAALGLRRLRLGRAIA